MPRSSRGLFLSGFSTKILFLFLILPCMLHAPPTCSQTPSNCVLLFQGQSENSGTDLVHTLCYFVKDVKFNSYSINTHQYLARKYFQLHFCKIHLQITMIFMHVLHISKLQHKTMNKKYNWDYKKVVYA
jgi:hypothetical protein